MSAGLSTHRMPVKVVTISPDEPASTTYSIDSLFFTLCSVDRSIIPGQKRFCHLDRCNVMKIDKAQAEGKKARNECGQHGRNISSAPSFILYDAPRSLPRVIVV